MAIVRVEVTSRWEETDKNDERRLGQLSGFVRLNNKREWQPCWEEQHDYTCWGTNAADVLVEWCVNQSD